MFAPELFQFDDDTVVMVLAALAALVIGLGAGWAHDRGNS